MGALLVGLGAIAVSALLLACLLRFASVVSFLLAAYLIAWTEIVAVVVALSAGGWVERGPLLGTFVAIAAVACGVWILWSRPRPPSLRVAARSGLLTSSDPLVAAPLLMSAMALLYTLVVTLTTTPNDGDPLAYELTRAAFWRQEHGIVDLEAAYVPLDFWPPVAEIAALVVMTLSGNDQATGLTQWLAVFALALATFGVGRRIGLDHRSALWGASLVILFPVVVTQSWSAFTDIVFASFAVAAVYFGLASRRVELLPLALATGLAMGTKFLGPILAPLFLVILAVAQPVRRWLPVLGAAIVGAAIASLWYLRTLFETGHPVGNEGAGLQSRELAPVVTTFQLLTSEIFDLSGSAGRDVWLYTVVGVALVAVALVARYGFGKRVSPSILVAGLLIAAAPHLVSLVGRAYARSGLFIGTQLGRPDLVDQFRGWRPADVSDGAYSWFGPIGVLLAFGAIVVAFVEVRRRRLPRVAILLAAAPVVAVALISVTVSYQNHQGRYFMSAFALCIATCGGFALRHRWVGATVVGVAGVTVVLALVNSLGKPTGTGVLHTSQGRSVWTMPRWEQQGILRSSAAERDEVMTFRFVQERIPKDASVGVALAYNSFVFPYFGRTLERTLAIVDAGDVVPDEVDWIVASPDQPLKGCTQAWKRERLGPHGWSVWRRIGTDECPTAERLNPP